MLAVALVLIGSGCTEGTPRPDEAAAPSDAPTSSTPSRGGPTRSPPGPSLTQREQQLLDTRLIAAAWANDVPRARQLIAAGADVNAEDDSQQSAFLVATSEGHLELLELTLRHGADVNAKDSFDGTGVIRAAERGHWRIVGRLIRAGTSLDHVNNLGWTGLHEAIILGDGGQRHLDTVRVLVAAGADVELPSANDGVTPVQHADAHGYDDIAELLTAAIGTPPGTRSGRADQELLAAARTGDASAAALALRAGARLEVRDAQRRTPLLLAESGDHLEVARLLVALGAEPTGLDGRHDIPGSPGRS